MSRTVASLAAAALLAALPAAAGAQEMRPVLTSASAQTIATTCAAYARQKGWALSIAVLDQGGTLIAFLRMDGSRLSTVDTAQWKANGSAKWTWPTKQMAERMAQVPGFAYAPNLAPIEGGVPIFDKTGKVALGGVGVSGAASAEDAECARAGIAAAGLRDTRAE